jgi:toxin ParE1/3/4
LKVVFTQAALADLQDIGDYIASAAPARAAAFVRELRDIGLRIGLAPRGYPVVRHQGGRETRMRSHKRHLIFYHAEPDQVAIIRIIHGARDHTRLLFGSEQ